MAIKFILSKSLTGCETDEERQVIKNAIARINADEEYLLKANEANEELKQAVEKITSPEYYFEALQAALFKVHRYMYFKRQKADNGTEYDVEIDLLSRTVKARKTYE